MNTTTTRLKWGGALAVASALSVSLLNAAPPVVPPAPAKKAAAGDKKPADDAGGGMDLDIGLGDDTSAINVEVSNPSKQAFDKAQTQMGAEDYAGAAASFQALLKDPKAKEYFEQSEYLLAKALYRLGFYHASLSRFVGILGKGEKHKYFKTSKEWLFFISRKAADQGVVVEEIARYAAQDLPEKYADEFHFLLAKLYFGKGAEEALVREDPAPPPEEDGKPAPGKAKPEENMEFDPNDVGGGGDAVAGSAGDDFDFGLDDLEEKPKKGKEKEKEKDKGKGKAAPEPVTPPPAKGGKTAPEPAKGKFAPVEPAPAPAPAKGKKDKEEKGGMTFGGGGTTEKEAAPEPPVVQRALVADQKDALQKCVEHASQVKPESELHLKAVYLQAVCAYEMQDFEKAVGGFREVVKLTKSGKWKNSPLREEAFFSLARTHYSFRQFRAAIFYYNKISRDSAGWLDSLFESSWAYFRLADYEKALGNLVTIHAPFFANEYFPESLILKAVTYYENCRYPEALGVLDEFEGQYGPLRDELDRLTKDAKTPEDYYALLKTLENTKNASALSIRLVKLARSDKNLAIKNASARELEAEEAKIQKSAGIKDTELQKELLDLVKKRREQTAKEAGTIARAKLEAERDELKSLSSQLFRIKFEVIKREKEGLEASLRGEKQGTQLGAYKFSSAVADTDLYWPFDGEYWRDELGTYEYTLSKGCRQ